MGEWMRARFYVASEDYRPVNFPPPGPYWCTGHRGSDDAAILVAYVKAESEIRDFWPEAEMDSIDERQELMFTDRFPKPHWWAEIEAGRRP